ncbi:YycH family regulatory protein [Marinicrinis sediminis]|uniref:YycH family regulatory protein n=1 Tax=Marinicrinis sediminis TaxID=1652465 RepID=A0ABW5RB53_9BACL
MYEKLKSTLLSLLVVVSLWQTFLLVNSKPEFERMDSTSYVQTELEGSRLEVQDLLFPREIVLHFGDDRHSVLYPSQEFYKKIYEEKIKQRTFDGFRPLSRSAKNWEELRTTTRGLEIRFQDSIPISILQTILQLRGDFIYTDDEINRIWIANEGEGDSEVRVYFFSGNGLNVYESTQADLQPSDIEQYVAFGEYMNSQNNYRSRDGLYYLPEQNLPAVRLKFTYETFTPEQWKNSLFVDPSISRNFAEKDGTEIYTDGKRGLQINQLDKWMAYSDPVAPVQEWADIRNHFYSAVQFINQHGGWNGTYMLQAYPEPWNQQFTFMQYIGMYPVIATEMQPYGQIRLTMQKSIVSNYERSMLQLQEEVSRTEMTLVGGDRLQELIAAHSSRNEIVHVFPAFQASVNEKYVEMIPMWAIQKSDGSFDMLPTR